jgi:membrane protease YdiL (CAAX protease family)
MSSINRDDAEDDATARRLRGFGPVGLLAMVAILFAGNVGPLPLGGLLTLAWAWRSGTPWRAIGYVRPASWTQTILLGIAFGIAFKLLLKAIVMPLFGANPINEAFQYLVGNRSALLPVLWSGTVVAAFGEETVMRGFLFERLGKLFGTSAVTKTVIVLITAAVFGLAHYTLQGVDGVLQGTIVGLVHGSIFAATGRIWFLIIAHAAFNVTAALIIYWNLERTVAQLLP